MSEEKKCSLYQNERPQGSIMGLSGGIGPSVGGPGCSPMTKAALNALEVRPNAFTGKWRGQHYYKGKVWEGPSNEIGHGHLVMVERSGSGTSWGIRGIGVSAVAAQ